MVTSSNFSGEGQAANNVDPSCRDIYYGRVSLIAEVFLVFCNVPYVLYYIYCVYFLSLPHSIQYNPFGFNCEAFTSVCAGLYDYYDWSSENTIPEVPHASPNPNPLYRPIDRRVDQKKVKPESRDQATR